MCQDRIELFSFTSVCLLLVGVVFILWGIVERRFLIYWYQDMGEHSWFFWMANLPYIEHLDGIQEFVNYRSKMFFALGSIHLVVGVIFIPLPDIWPLMFVWTLLLLLIGLALRYDYIDVALEINRKYSHQLTPKKVCPKCGKELWLDLKICPRCEEKLRD